MWNWSNKGGELFGKNLFNEAFQKIIFKPQAHELMQLLFLSLSADGVGFTRDILN